MNKEASFLEEISEQELDQLNGGAGAAARAVAAAASKAMSLLDTLNTPSGGSCSVQDIMNDYC